MPTIYQAAEIPLTRGRVAIVDADVLPELSGYNWRAIVDNRDRGSCYAVADVRTGGKKITVTMHRLIMKAAKGVQVDHRNGDGLDNRRSNLRLATIQQNSFNRGPNRNNKSGYKGVYWGESSHKWYAQIKINGHKRTIGFFEDKREAWMAYADAAAKLHGEFARATPFAPKEVESAHT